MTKFYKKQIIFQNVATFLMIVSLLMFVISIFKCTFTLYTFKNFPIILDYVSELNANIILTRSKLFHIIKAKCKRKNKLLLKST